MAEMRVCPAIIVSLVLACSGQAFEVFDILTGSSPSASRAGDWKPGDGLALEVGGMAWVGPDRLAVAIRKGEVWLIDGVLSDNQEDLKFQRFASGLHEPLGLLRDGDDFLCAQRTEVTRLSDSSKDGIADGYLTEASGWAVTGNYHAYTYGPERDGEGKLWVTLNVGMGERADNTLGWHGWGGTIGEDFDFIPQAMGMRSPSGLGANRAGDMFFSDQQGTWVPATPIHHLRPGVFYGNQEAMATRLLPESGVQMDEPPPSGVPYPEALRSNPVFVPPAVWLPYNKMGRSATDLELIDCGGKFGPFDGQFLVGEFTNSGINRVFLEKVGGEYQGACFPFLQGFPAAVFRLEFAPDGSLFVGMTNRGWSSLGNRSYGLQRVRLKDGEVPFSVREMRAKPDGFELEFTEPLDPRTVDPASFEMSSYTYLYSSAYGSKEIDTKQLQIVSAILADDGQTVRLQVDCLRELFVHELHLDGLRSERGGELVHPRAYYTLNQIPG
jgi:hypothetical protein